MKIDDIIETIWSKIQYIKRDRREPGAIVVSYKIMYDIKNGFYEPRDRGYPYYPYYTQMKQPAYDKMFGLPISVIELSDDNEEYIEVYAKA